MSTTVVVVHGGASGVTDEFREHGSEYHAALERALIAGADALHSGGGAVEAVCAAVIVLESVPLFNAGHGSALCSDESVEMSASVMRGSDRAAGGVAMMTRTAHPVAAAVALLDQPEVLLAGASADAHAVTQGLEQRHPDEFVTERQHRRLAERLASDRVAGRESHPRTIEPETVGAVCLDATGVLAAATSTGGITGQRPGRVGDSPLIGAGTWADRHVAVSCTGQGEAFIRSGAARLVAALVEHRMTLESAAHAALAEVAECGGSGGLIAVDAGGNVAVPMSTGAMPRGVWRPGQNPVTTVP
jgi:isoaspartyl peptidase/L-asparaginase-like protein (Ntn-hydrolase superfamily)